MRSQPRDVADKLEGNYIRHVLVHTKDDKVETAKILGISRKDLYKRMQYHSILPSE